MKRCKLKNTAWCKYLCPIREQCEIKRSKDDNIKKDLGIKT